MILEKMKTPKLNQLILALLCMLSFIFINAQSETEIFDYFARQPRYIDFNKRGGKWTELEKDTVVYTAHLGKGSPCDTYDYRAMKIKISNDTIFVDRGKREYPCDPRIGSALVGYEFVLNKKKYPNYKDLKIIYRRLDE
jgi:hypothetical protein